MKSNARWLVFFFIYKNVRLNFQTKRKTSVAYKANEDDEKITQLKWSTICRCSKNTIFSLHNFHWNMVYTKNLKYFLFKKKNIYTNIIFLNLLLDIFEFFIACWMKWRCILFKQSKMIFCCEKLFGVRVFKKKCSFDELNCKITQAFATTISMPMRRISQKVTLALRPNSTISH